MWYGHLYIKLLSNPISVDYYKDYYFEESWSIKEEQKKIYNTWVLIICIHIYLFFICMSPDTPIPIYPLKLYL